MSLPVVPVALSVTTMSPLAVPFVAELVVIVVRVTAPRLVCTPGKPASPAKVPPVMLTPPGAVMVEPAPIVNTAAGGVSTSSRFTAVAPASLNEAVSDPCSDSATPPLKMMERPAWSVRLPLPAVTAAPVTLVANVMSVFAWRVTFASPSSVPSAVALMVTSVAFPSGAAGSPKATVGGTGVTPGVPVPSEIVMLCGSSSNDPVVPPGARRSTAPL